MLHSVWLDNNHRQPAACLEEEKKDDSLNEITAKLNAQVSDQQLSSALFVTKNP